MKLLILGGTVFLGRHLVEAALRGNHEVTLFNRGQSAPELFPEVEKLRGDRSGELESLRGRQWDAVVDLSAYLPRSVRKSAELLAGAVEHYTLISSIAVYSNFSVATYSKFSERDLDENAPTSTLPESIEVITNETYGPLKRMCERTIERFFPGRALCVRPGVIVGPHDPTDRFTYWAHRVSLGGEVLVPGRPTRHVQLIDARDLAEWILRMVEARGSGPYNAVGPKSVLSMQDLVESCLRVSGSSASFIWVSQQFLIQEGVVAFTEMPFWVTEEAAGVFSINNQKAHVGGLSFRPLELTIRDTLNWSATRPTDKLWRAGLRNKREKELLQGWHSRVSSETTVGCSSGKPMDVVVQI